MRLLRSSSWWVLGLAFFFPALRAETQPGYYRFPALHDDTLVFTAEGDLWRVAASGGIAQRLTSHPGAEILATISPDGQTVAFTGQYEGQSELYSMPLTGGLPKRLTFEGDTPGAAARGWTPDGRILYSTRHYSTLPNNQLVAIDPRTLAHTFIPLAQADEGVYDDSGKTLFFTRFSFQSSHAKRYKGGTAQNLWRLADGETAAMPLTADYQGTSRWPMFWQGRVYFASDRDGTMNLWSMKTDGSDLQQLTHHADFGVKTPSLSRGRIAYQNGADLWLLDLASGKTAVVPITLVSDFDAMREKWVTKPMEYLTYLSLSPTGDRVALTVRGQVFVAAAGPGRLVEVTRQSGVRYRQAQFNADGKSLLLLSDESGEVEFWRGPANGVGPLTQLTKGGQTLRVKGLPSPDGNWIVSAERNQELWLFNSKTGEKRLIATSTKVDFDEADLAWSPDSQWIAYGNSRPNDFQVIYLYSLASAQSTAATSERTNSFSPAWSPDGKWLYFLSERALQSVVGAPWGVRQPEPFLDRPVKIYQLALSTDTKRSPFQPDDELSAPEPEPKKDRDAKPAKEEKPREDKPKDDKPLPEIPKDKSPPKGELVKENPPTEEKVVTATEKKPAESSNGKKPVTVTIQLDGLVSRLWEIPVAAGNYGHLSAADKTLFLTDRPRGADAASADPGNRLLAVEIKNKDVESVTVTAGVTAYELSADGKKLLVRKTNDLYVIEAAAKSATLDKAKVDLGALKFSFLPRESWRQMFTDAWRLHRDYFYDPSMHGVDWRANLAKHLPLVDRVTDRAELNDVLTYMMSELSSLHTGLVPGDVRTGPEDENISVALLGARLVRDEAHGGWRIEHIYLGDPDYPDKLSPLARPGQHLVEGDIVESINGVPTLSVPDVESLLRNQAGRQVLLHVKPAGEGAGFDTIVTAINSGAAADLRYTDWEVSRRQHVDQAADNQIGYVHIRAMGNADYSQWARDYYPVIDRPGLILDLRHNRGGNIESWLISRLMRPSWMWWQPREGDPVPNMQNPFRGHLIALTDELTASDGETMANGIRHLHLGTLLGTRTWGGGVWLRAINTLVDRGIITAAENGSFVPGEGWAVEGPGITPDVIVDNNPASSFRGEDTQLDAAIAKMKELIAKDPRPLPTPPPYPLKALKK